MLSEISHLQKDRFCTIPLILGFQNGLREAKIRMTFPGFRGNGKIGNCCSVSTKFQLHEVTVYFFVCCNCTLRSVVF